MSRKPGIGLNYLTDEIKAYYLDTKNSFVTLTGGIKQPLGRYYKDKIFGETQHRKDLQIKVAKYVEKLEKLERQLHEDDKAYIRHKQLEYELGTKRAKYQLTKNNKL